MEVTMSTVLQSLSTELADAVESAGRAVVAIHARRRIPASGVHWRPGVIVATHHTINRDENITVTLPDGTTAPVSLAGRDPSTDLAVLKLAGQNLPTAKLRSDSPPAVGELVVALGRPGPSVTASWGVMSRVDGPWRTWQGAEIDSLLRLDLAIYDGFSGGLLIDAAGRVLGINTSGLARGVPVDARGWKASVADGIAHKLAAAVEQPRRAVMQTRKRGQAAGAGVIWDERLVIPNAHFVRGERATIELHDGTAAPARVVRRDL